MAIVKISDLPLVDSPVEGTDLFVVVQDNVTKKAYASDIQTYVGFEEVQTATAGQTVFNLTTMTYAAGANNLMVFVDGVNQYEGSSYVETDNNTVTFTQGLHEGALVKFSTVQTQTSSVANAGAVVYNPAGTGAVPTSVQAKLRETVSVTDFGADPTGVNDSAPAILAAFDYIRTNGGGNLVFPNSGNAIYTISYGFRVPSNCVIYLNGCTIQATTTFGQGALPSVETTAGAFFNVARPNSESPLANFLENIAFIGDNAILDGRRDEQTGSPAACTPIKFETTDTPQQVDNLKIRNVVIRDITIDRSGYDGVYIQGVDGLLLDNVRVNYALRVGFVGISGERVTFNDCLAYYTIGDNPNAPYQGPGNSGDGYWNEPNESWQNMNKWSYVNCKAIGNYQAGFKVWNAGADAQYFIQLDNCYAYLNVYDPYAAPAALRSAPGEGAFTIGTNLTSSAQAMVVFNNCVAEAENGAGFAVNIGGTGGLNQRFIFNNCTVLNCNQNNTNSVNRAPIRIGVGAYTATPTIVIANPTIIAPPGNTLGYGIYAGSAVNVHIANPVFINNFTTGVIIDPTNAPLPTQREKASFDAGSEAHTFNTIFNKPVNFALFDQTSQPDPATEIFKNEVVLWQDDNNQITGVYRRDDSDTPKFINFNPKKRLRGVVNLTGSAANIAAQDVETGTVAVTGAVLGDIVAISATANLDADLILTARVSAADTVSYYIHNPSAGTVSRAATFLVVNVIGSDY